jgi:hypothetical protein
MPGVRIVVCGYEGDGYETLAAAHGWEEVKWKAHGGYANQGAKKRARLKAELAPENRERERIWFSPQCKRDASLF